MDQKEYMQKIHEGVEHKSSAIQTRIHTVLSAPVARWDQRGAGKVRGQHQTVSCQSTAGQTLKRFRQGFLMNSDDCQRKSGDTFTSSTTTQALLLLLATYLQSCTTFRRLKEQKARFLDEDHVPVVAAQRDGCFEPWIIHRFNSTKKRTEEFVYFSYLNPQIDSCKMFQMKD